MLSWENYWKRYIDIFIQSDLARKAMSAFRDTSEAVRKYATDEFEVLRKDIHDHLEKRGLNPHETWIYDNAKIEKYLNDTMTAVPTRLQSIENRINQNQLIIIVALFEAFMKDIHREVLRQNPGLLNSDRKVSIGRILGEGLNSVVEEEIAREVHGLDRKTIEERCEYFKNRLSIDWSFNDTMPPLLKYALESRNAILHENPDLEISESDVTVAMIVCMAIPMVAMVQAHLHYPDGFVLPDHSENMTRLFRKEIEAKHKIRADGTNRRPIPNKGTEK